jgi:putative PIN family toxin of toxin-antitoxin system
MRVVLDTNVVVSGLRSARGASHALLRSLPSPSFDTVLSTPLYLEYQAVLLRPGMLPSSYDKSDIMAVCRFIASISHLQDVFFLWRPLLPDPKDDMVVELAFASGSRYIVTHNISDFGPAVGLGVRAVRPGDFIEIIGGPP